MLFSDAESSSFILDADTSAPRPCTTVIAPTNDELSRVPQSRMRVASDAGLGVFFRRVVRDVLYHMALTRCRGAIMALHTTEGFSDASISYLSPYDPLWTAIAESSERLRSFFELGGVFQGFRAAVVHYCDAIRAGSFTP